MKKYLTIFSLVILALVLAQCSQRENPVDSTSQAGRYWSLFFESNAIQNDRMQDFWFRNILVYTPPGYDAGDTLRPIATGIDQIVPGDTVPEIDSTGADTIWVIIPPETTFVYGDTAWGTYYPVLYLLHGYGGNHNYYKGLYGLAEVMDEMITSGQINPMIVVTPNATNNLGGSFYTNSPDFGTGQSYGGLMQDFITEEVVHIVDSVYNTMPLRSERGIAGHSMGGYGAVKLAMLRNDLFGAAASMSGTLAFWGTNPADTIFDGFMEAVPMIFAENNALYGDLTSFYRITPGPGKRITNFFFAMGAAFSPHDPANPDTSYAHRFTTNQFAGYIDLPFDAYGQVAPSVWNLWMANDVTALFAAGYGGVFDSTALYIDAGVNDDLGLQHQMDVFASVLNQAGVVHSYEKYSDYSSQLPANHTMLISERLRKVAKFSSDYFSR